MRRAAGKEFSDVERLHGSPGEELHALGPLEVGAGFRFGLSYSVTDLEIVKDFTK